MMPSKNKQSGVVLVISLVMLLLLTLIGITGMSTTSLEEKMAGNAKDRNTAFQAAESTLVEAEICLKDGSLYSGNPKCTNFDGTVNGLLPKSASEPDYLSLTWNASNSHSTPSGFGASFGLSDTPRYIIQIVDDSDAPTKITYRITARAVGSVSGTQVILQEIYEVTF